MSQTKDIKADIQSLYKKLVQALELKPRWGQKQMIASIANHFLAIKKDSEGVRLGENPACIIEAGTGTGKTLAYVVACLPIAKALGKKLVISTATIALQEQIMSKDLPAIRQHGDIDFAYALAKGRRRYLCVSRLDSALTNNQSIDPNQALFEDELALKLDTEQQGLYQKMLNAISQDEWDGDRDNWSDSIEEDYWYPVTTDHRGCSNRRCHYFNECPFFKARAGLEQSDCIVTNHDLVLADLQLGGGIVLPNPEDTIYIFDEGHHLADKTLKQFTHRVGLRQLQRWYGQVRTSSKRFVKEWQGGSRVSQIASELQNKLTHLEDMNEIMESLVDQPEYNLGEYNGFQDSSTYRFPHGVIPDAIRAQANQLAAMTSQLTKDLDGLYEQVEQVVKDEQVGLDKERAEIYMAVIGGWAQASLQQQGLWQAYACIDTAEEAPYARWLEHFQTSERADIELAASPILAHKLLHQNLWQRCFATLVTSATLLALGRFEQLLMHTGLSADSTQLALASPFDFASSTLHIPREAVEPGPEDTFVDALLKGIPACLDKQEGSLVLFTSRRVMQRVFDGLPTHWQDLILMQGESSKQRQLMQHQQRLDEGEGSVLFGLASFAEGIDLPGKYLTHLVITRLPFTVPDRPVAAALAEWVECNGKNAFIDISVPEASVRLIQATGRLLRQESDKGRITVLDKRLHSKRYGKQLLQSLPPYTLQVDV